MRSGFLLAIGTILFLAGCGFHRVANDGRRIPQSEYAFLNQTNVTHQEVAATLGPANYESTDHRVMLYYWGFNSQSANWNVLGRSKEAFEITNGKTKTLLIEFNEGQTVIRHEVADSTPEASFEQIARKWRSVPEKAP
jgi:hypothetical protein